MVSGGVIIISTCSFNWTWHFYSCSQPRTSSAPWDRGWLLQEQMYRLSCKTVLYHPSTWCTVINGIKRGVVSWASITCLQVSFWGPPKSHGGSSGSDNSGSIKVQGVDRTSAHWLYKLVDIHGMREMLWKLISAMWGLEREKMIVKCACQGYLVDRQKCNNPWFGVFIIDPFFGS